MGRWVSSRWSVGRWVDVFNKTLKEHAPVFVKNMTEDFINRKMEEFNKKIGITLTNNEIKVL